MEKAFSPMLVRSGVHFLFWAARAYDSFSGTGSLCKVMNKPYHIRFGMKLPAQSIIVVGPHIVAHGEVHFRVNVCLDDVDALVILHGRCEMLVGVCVCLME